MAKHTSDREDLLREATALIQRAELQLDNGDEPAVIGFRANSAASFFIHPQRVYHFNTRGELRRAYVDDRLIKAEKRELVTMERQPVESRIRLVRHPLSAQETEQFLKQLEQRLVRVQQQLLAGQYRLIGQVPADVDVIDQIHQWLSVYSIDIRIAEKPHLA